MPKASHCSEEDEEMDDQSKDKGEERSWKIHKNYKQKNHKSNILVNTIW